MNQKDQSILQAYEVYSLVGGGYGKRHVHGYAWTRTDVQTLADTIHPRRYHIGVIHLIRVDGRWHRIHATSVETIIGDETDAEESRIALNDVPVRTIPAICYEVQGGSPKRLCNNLEKAINLLASLPDNSVCKLFTLRTGGRLPLSFRIGHLLAHETTQKQVFEWLRHEIAFREQLGEQHEAA